MSQKIRQEQILHILKQQGYVTVRYLVDALQYSTATVNRDLNAMQLRGLVRRSYGGVELTEQHRLPPLVQREFYRKQEKRRIAREAAGHIRSGDTVFLDASTTVQYIVPFLFQKKDVRVITNSLRVASELGDSGLEVICLGGGITERPYVLDGDITVENAMKYRPDIMFFSVGQVTKDGAIQAAHYLLYKTLLKSSREVWFLTDRTKLTDRLSNVLCDFSCLTGCISDFDFPEQTKQQFPNVQFTVAEDTGEE